MKRGLFLFIVLFLVGCVPNNKTLSLHKTHPNTKTAYKELLQKYVDENKTDDLLADYDAGTIGFWVNDYDTSVKFFDYADYLINKYDREITSNEIKDTIVSALTNDTFLEYRPKIYEKVMVNFYKAVDFMNLNNLQNARVEFNRALIRIEDAKEFFKKEIEKEEEKILKESKNEKVKKSFDVKKIASNPKTLDFIKKKYSNLFAFKAYKDFTNPFVDYLAGIYFLNVGDYAKATDLLKEAYGIINGVEEGSDYVLADFALADKLKGSVLPKEGHYVWVIFFNSRIPKIVGKEFNIPLFLVSDNLIYAGIALPYLEPRPRVYEYLDVNGKKTKVVTSMDRIVKNEFKKRFPLIVQRALIRLVTQTVLQKQLNDKLGFFGKLAGAIYQKSMNKVDTRCWDKLPKEFQVVRIKTPNKLKIKAGNKVIFSLNTDPNKNYIVFVTIPDKQTSPFISYKEF